MSSAAFSQEELASWLAPATYQELLPLIARAGPLAEAALELCAIANVGFGACGEDCAFCAQNRKLPPAAAFELSLEEILRQARQAKARGANRFSLVTSGGYCPEGERLRRICKAIEALRVQAGILPCASLGILRQEQARRLYEAGLVRYHHNLESAESFFPNICSSHTWQERWRTNLLARQAGLEICCGGLLGLGESLRQRAEFALTLGRLRPHSIALNFFIPPKGSRLQADITPLRALAACAVFKLASPSSRLRLCGGREQHLGVLAPLAHFCGLGGLMVGDYLTTKGVAEDKDRLEIAALGRALEKYA